MNTLQDKFIKQKLQLNVRRELPMLQAIRKRNNMNKSWYKSRGIWIAIMTMAAGTAELVRDAIISGDWSAIGIATLVLGILKLWERITRTA